MAYSNTSLSLSLSLSVRTRNLNKPMFSMFFFIILMVQWTMVPCWWYNGTNNIRATRDRGSRAAAPAAISPLAHNSCHPTQFLPPKLPPTLAHPKVQTTTGEQRQDFLLREICKLRSWWSVILATDPAQLHLNISPHPHHPPSLPLPLIASLQSTNHSGTKK